MRTNRFLPAVILPAVFFIVLSAHVTPEAFRIFEPRCTACHALFEKNGKAPPLMAVQQVYLRLFENDAKRAEAAMRSFLSVPAESKVLMKPAAKLYGRMPKLDMNASEIEEYSKALVEIEFEVPGWFEEHYRSHKLGRAHRDGFQVP